MAQFNRCSENAVLTISFEAIVLHDGLKANVQLVHSMDATMDWNEKNICFSVTKSAAFMHPRA